MKLYTNGAGNIFAHCALIAADLANQNVEVVMKTNDEWKADKDMQKINLTMKFPLLQLDSGACLFESSAIAAHFGRKSHMGSSAFQTGQCEQWIGYTQASVWPTVMPVLMAVLGHKVVPQKDFNEGVKRLKSLCKVLDTYLKGKEFLVGNSVTVADIVLATAFIVPFQTVLDGGFRKGMPNFSNYFIKMMANPAVVKRVGSIKPIEKALPAFNPDAAPAAAEADDEMDLFGDDDEDDGAAAAAAAAAAKAKAAKKNKVKPPEMSLIVFEVKPLDDTTNLDDLAKKIFAQTQEGLIWKTGDYKKIPVAFGIFKLIVGMSCVDSQVSVDDVQERIESIEDMVQSVEIASFTKI